MRRIPQFFNAIIRFSWRFRRCRPEDIPKRLPPEALAMVLKEAAFLKGSHGVDVQYLAEGEEAGMPRPADGSQLPEKPASV
jgi:hypothetical protein